MRPVATILLSLLLLAACGRKPPASKSPATKPHPPLPVVTVADVPSPKTESVILEPGSNLRTIAAAAYGHERFSGFVATLNGIGDPTRVAAGTTLKTPSLAVAFRDAGADPVYQPALNVLAKACTDYFAAEPAYLEARKASGVPLGKFPIPAEIKQKFIASADAVDAAIFVLGQAKPPHTVPKMTIGQFKEAAEYIRKLASGSIEENGYDYDLVGQRFGLGFTNALIWTQQHHR